jgi:riboflavin synthase
MFTGIIETLGEIVEIKQESNNVHFGVKSLISPELKIDQSVAHSGVCLTVTEVSSLEEGKAIHWVTAIHETLQKTNLRTWKVGTLVNLERCMKMGDRLDGHIVQGHVDQIGTCLQITDQGGSWLFTFEYEPLQRGYVTVEKGSICVNGTSLTVVNSQEKRFSVAIIPYTYQHTNFQTLAVGDMVNLEFDIIGKYVERLLNRV